MPNISPAKISTYMVQSKPLKTSTLLQISIIVIKTDHDQSYYNIDLNVLIRSYIIYVHVLSFILYLRLAAVLTTSKSDQNQSLTINSVAI